MDNPDLHGWLQQRLRTQAAALRTDFGHRLPTSAELDALLLLERLADDVENVSEHLALLFQMMLLIEGIAVNFEGVSDALFQKIGFACVPRDASDLVRWLIVEVLQGERRQQPCAAFSPGHPLSARSADALASSRPERPLRIG